MPILVWRDLICLNLRQFSVQFISSGSGSLRHKGLLSTRARMQVLSALKFCQPASNSLDRRQCRQGAAARPTNDEAGGAVHSGHQLHQNGAPLWRPNSLGAERFLRACHSMALCELWQLTVPSFSATPPCFVVVCPCA